MQKTHSDKSNHNSKLSRPSNLYINKRYTCDENTNLTLKSTSSEEESSPSELNNCRKIIDKPTLVSIKISFYGGYYVVQDHFGEI